MLPASSISRGPPFHGPATFLWGQPPPAVQPHAARPPQRLPPLQFFDPTPQKHSASIPPLPELPPRTPSPANPAADTPVPRAPRLTPSQPPATAADPIPPPPQSSSAPAPVKISSAPAPNPAAQPQHSPKLHPARPVQAAAYQYQ